MTQFEHLELIYNQFLNLADEINALIEEEDYESVVDKLEHKDKLVKKILMARKTVNFTDEEIEKARLIEQKIRENENETLVLLTNLQNEIGEELLKTRKKIKMSTAYTVIPEESQGYMVDISE